ncbi:hypothetical protein CYMTET_51150 [Cymbomonas tetramitiformis]|uniref:Uncharacterized protein n=1 Tax=Cymbomonas tetramitiformis TaxID=36881 RepID=A0AAE0ESG0_9CHLO|nr:hypothetical protein CYMTET_51150 [Cymbomonas tetramitiformis]
MSHENSSGKASVVALTNEDLLRLLRGEQNVLNTVNLPSTYEAVSEVKERLDELALPVGVKDSWATVLLIYHAANCPHVPDPTGNADVFRKCSRNLSRRMALHHEVVRKAASIKRPFLQQKAVLVDLCPRASHDQSQPQTVSRDTVNKRSQKVDPSIVQRKRQRQIEVDVALRRSYAKKTTSATRLKTAACDLVRAVYDGEVTIERMETEFAARTRASDARVEELERKVKQVQSTYQTRNVNKRIRRLEESIFNLAKHNNELQAELEVAAAATQSEKEKSEKRARQKQHSKLRCKSRRTKEALHNATNITTQEADGTYCPEARALVMDLNTHANVNPDSCPKAIRVFSKHFGVNISSIPSRATCHTISAERAVVNEHYIGMEWSKSDEPTNVVRSSDGTTAKNLSIEAEQLTVKQGGEAKKLAVSVEWQHNHTTTTQVKVRLLSRFIMFVNRIS